MKYTMIALAGLTLAIAPAAAQADGGDRIERHFDKKGDRIDQRLDRRGERINARLDRRGERLEHRWDKGHGRGMAAGRGHAAGYGRAGHR